MRAVSPVGSGCVDKQPPPLRIQVPAHVAASFESIVSRVADTDAEGGGGRLWKIVRSFDDPATWTEPHVRHLSSSGPAGDIFRTEPLPDQWELYDLDTDPIEADNRCNDSAASAVFETLRTPPHGRARPRGARTQRAVAVCDSRTGRRPAHEEARPPRARLRKLLQRAGLHPDDTETFDIDLTGRARPSWSPPTTASSTSASRPASTRASSPCRTTRSSMPAWTSTSPARAAARSRSTRSHSGGPCARRHATDSSPTTISGTKVDQSLAIGDVDIAAYDIVYLAGGWGAAFDLGFSEDLGRQITAANEQGSVIGGVCHGPLGLLKANAADGSPLVEGRRVTAVTDKQVPRARDRSTPHHPETELRKLGAEFESATRFREPLANHWVVDGNLVTGQNQNAAPMVAREMLRISAEPSPDETRPSHQKGESIAPMDGRAARRERNKNECWTWCSRCSRSDLLFPTIEQASKRSGLSLRSLYRYFAWIRASWSTQPSGAISKTPRGCSTCPPSVRAPSNITSRHS